MQDTEAPAPAASGHPRAHRRWPVAAILGAVVVLGVACRTAVAAQGWFYWDDLTLHAQARGYDAPTLELLLTDHDGHLMPAAWVIEWLLATRAPLNWPAAVATLGLLQLAAAAAVAWACLVLCPRVSRVTVAERGVPFPWAAVPLVAYLFTPLTLPSTTWLATAVNTLPLHAALALVFAHSVLTLREPHRAGRHLTVAVTALVAGLLFSERALFAGPAVVLALVCLAAATGSVRRRWRGIARTAATLAVPTLAWAGVYLAVTGDPRTGDGTTAAPDATGTAGAGTGVLDLFVHGYVHALLPTAAGGPWHWERWHPSPPWAAPGPAAVAAGALVVAGILVWTARRHPRHLLTWLPVLVYPLAPLAALAIARTGPGTSVEITQTLRHFSEVAVLGAVTLAFLLAHPRPERRTRRIFRWAGTLAAGLVAVSTAVSTVIYAQVWADQPARDYFHTLRGELAGRDEPVFDQAVDLHVLLPLVHPYNMLSKLIGGLEGVPPFERWTTDPVLVDGDGHLRPAELVAMRATEPGSGPGCGTRVGPEDTAIAVDGPLLERDWVLQFNYFADQSGTVELALDGEPVEIPVEAGLSQVYVSLSGGGRQLHVTPTDGVTELCVGRNQIGVLAVRR
ncbi:hypothetical protein [Corynebacterium halotolerans]|uniref:Glycosyltransferase RgtA/B/C/D-like domain-containing protein n=1 Tax=Corynebacterium halotolerans YIM 70093 = DSM 44683 TaxID=1121362 RepID=M1MVZ0_9CORY|nr:hypothetical protein [Corynebacterium halotolerans]AGF71904.1 hypothetical protein A605_04475 [Corynebacterium halotolerans YIM 70093 = DSM 44683]